MTDTSIFNPPKKAPIHGSTEGATSLGGGLTFVEVEDRLVEALLTCWRLPDRERGWLRQRSWWPEITREAGDYDARGGDGTSSDVAIRPASLTRREVGEMEEAFGWLDALDPVDRKLVALVVEQLARGQREPSWVRLIARLGLPRGAEGLRKRYGRAIASICARESGGNPSRDVSMG